MLDKRDQLGRTTEEDEEMTCRIRVGSTGLGGLICLVTAFLPANVQGQPSEGFVPEQSQPANAGFLIVEGQYISPPYIFRSDESGVSANGVSIEYTSLGLGEQEFFKWDMVPKEKSDDQAEPEVTFRRRPIRPRYPWRNIEPQLHSNSIVVILAGEKPVTLGKGAAEYDLLKLLTAGDGAIVTDEVLKGFGDIDRNRWRNWISEFRVSDEFLARANAEIQNIDAIRAENRRATAAIRRLDASSYPLTVAGMVLVVLAVGHLLTHRPATDVISKVRSLTENEHKAVVQSLILVVGLSILDLVWTLLAHQAGEMKELNPLGARFVNDPQALIALKVIATTVAAAILFFTRRHLFARQACWWCCLVCTLLAARWISLTSAFV